MLKWYFSGGLAAVFLLNGCALCRTEPVGVQRYVEPEAAYLQREEFREPALRLREWADAAKLEVMRSKLPDRRKRELCALLAAVQLAVRQIGLTENTAMAASGNPLQIRGARYWKTSRTLYFGRDAEKALLYRAAGPETMDLRKELADCPADALLTAGIVLNTAEIAAAAGPVMESFAGPLPKEFAEILKALSGRWTLQILPVSGVPAYRLSVPDRGGKVQKLLSPFLPSSGGNSFRLPGLDGMPPMLLSSGKERLTLYSGAVRKYTGPKLAELPEMQEFLQHLPEQGSGWLYLTPQFGKKMLQDTGAAMPFPEMPRILGVLIRQPDALQWQTLSTWDPVSESWLVPAMIFRTHLALTAMRTGDHLRKENTDRAARAGCVRNLHQIHSGLQTYARDHQGKFPAAGGIEGLRELLNEKLIEPAVLVCPAANGDAPAENAAKFGYENCSYVYIGGSGTGTQADFPLVFDWPLNHKNRFRVLTVSGRITEFNVEQLNSCRKAVSFLQSRFRFPEKDFRRMLETADQLDAKFLKGHSR